MGVDGLLGGPKQGPSAAEVQRQAEESAKREREKITLESAEADAKREQALQKSYSDAQTKRRAFVGAAVPEDETGRRKFLKGV